MSQRKVFEQFVEDLYQENPRAAWALESMKYGLMARTGMPEADALEVCARIAALSEDKQGETNQRLTNEKLQSKNTKRATMQSPRIEG